MAKGRCCSKSTEMNTALNASLTPAYTARKLKEERMKTKVNGIQLNYAVEGAGPWVVFSHSLACDLSMWDEQVAALKGAFKVLRFDTRGHGGSDAPAGRLHFGTACR